MSVCATDAAHELKLLSMEVSEDDESLYRIQSGSKVKYLIIQPGIFDYQDFMTFPPALLPVLPPFPEGPWKTMSLGRGDNGEVIQDISNEPLPAVQSIWHPTMIEVLSLQEIGSFRPRVRQVEYAGKTAIAKIARFDWEIHYVENETSAYRQLAGTSITPALLGHLTEEGRVMGSLLEKVEGRHACIEDIDACRTLVKKVHAAGLVHGDLNRYNFVIHGKQAWLIDFENSNDYDTEQAHQELEELDTQLREESGRGGNKVLPME